LKEGIPATNISFKEMNLKAENLKNPSLKIHRQSMWSFEQNIFSYYCIIVKEKFDVEVPWITRHGSSLGVRGYSAHFSTSRY